ncbi:GspE/PulE family protein [Burkholderia stagnalis]|uniref:GspE/PulE family protein n=1 Tax=Burkholderia stagnalis TaxID=1503054 RepID=UPI0007586BEA|nr:GspE/PulE family protein [Burkholderia stagnalis]KVO61492.1 general secretion pathway protein GspE [Burkholderia stagnalis]KVP13095.1 general secretion pathway protein GspE [Burkholderia stagnalis]KVW96608.1 general secretion pathway protein GspE [Burkholderia stagnalis]KWH75730.1 general secretion pathway protein GspE [Burkholderia stagnalis]KWK19081.1 general secretion pathway protein GspE [Burkholderia stagnalis]
MTDALVTTVRPDALLSQARTLALTNGEPVLCALEKSGDLSADDMLQFVAAESGMSMLRLAQMEAMKPDFTGFSYAECLQQNCVMLHDGDSNRFFVCDDPWNVTLITMASYRLHGFFELAFTHPLELKALLARFGADQEALSQLIRLDKTDRDASDAEEISLVSIASDESQVVRLVNSTLYDAHRNRVSDIHFENTLRGLSIKYRIDGVISTARVLPDPSMSEQVISRLKVMAELDIGEKRIPQDGRFSVTIQSREVDFRVSIMPGLFGEDAVLRILDRQSLTADKAKLTLDTLGIDTSTSQTIRRLANHPYGMLLVTGPTGSGKTTTLYATLSEIKRGDDKIITIEDPVEYQLDDILQIPVNEKKGLTFARGLRSILRHDPDRILVGEIRDRETAEIAIQAALTGHLVYTTVHANNVFDVLSRFRHMQVDPYSFVTALNGVVAQRLVRLICAHCAAPFVPEDALLHDSRVTLEQLVDGRLMRGKGCANCRGSGYRGRRALAEVLVLDDDLREAILQQTPASKLKEMARQRGMRMMREQAIDAVKRGQTTLEEINRVTFAD